MVLKQCGEGDLHRFCLGVRGAHAMRRRGGEVEAGFQGVGGAAEGECGAEDAVVVGGARGEDDAGGGGEVRFEEVGQEKGAEEIDSVESWEAVDGEFLTRQRGADAGVVKKIADGEMKGRRPGTSEGADGG